MWNVVADADSYGLPMIIMLLDMNSPVFVDISIATYIDMARKANIYATLKLKLCSEFVQKNKYHPLVSTTSVPIRVFHKTLW